MREIEEERASAASIGDRLKAMDLVRYHFLALRDRGPFALADSPRESIAGWGRSRA